MPAIAKSHLPYTSHHTHHEEWANFIFMGGRGYSGIVPLSVFCLLLRRKITSLILLSVIATAKQTALFCFLLLLQQNKQPYSAFCYCYSKTNSLILLSVIATAKQTALFCFLLLLQQNKQPYSAFCYCYSKTNSLILLSVYCCRRSVQLMHKPSMRLSTSNSTINLTATSLVYIRLINALPVRFSNDMANYYTSNI